MADSALAFDDDGDPLVTLSAFDLFDSRYGVSNSTPDVLRERAAIDSRRGLVVVQVVAIEDLLGEFVMYLEDTADWWTRRREIRSMPAGRLLSRWRDLHRGARIRSPDVDRLHDRVERVLHRRNALAHSRIEPTEHFRREGDADDLVVTDRIWRLHDERFGAQSDISMKDLRQDLLEAQETFRDLMSWAEWFVQLAPEPTNPVLSPWFASPTP